MGIWRLTKKFWFTQHTKVIAKRYSFTLRASNWQKIIGQKFRKSQKFRLTPGYRNLLNRTFCNGFGGRASGYRRILNIICSLGTTPLQSKTLTGQAQVKHDCIVTCTPSNETPHCLSTQSQSKMQLECSKNKDEHWFFKVFWGTKTVSQIPPTVSQNIVTWDHINGERSLKFLQAVS